ncbi:MULTISPECIES: hypothetical protein [unclassified Nocardia]|uniref:hypothetical protein n=1 Tax=unclassified Nocardia TaxID=2637762 RepID=UPI002E0E4A46|nr:hypothetical protein OG326_27120 [Nocardia sp. NBC_01327]
MAAGKHRALNPHRTKVGTVVAAGAVPLVLAIVGTGTANAAPETSNSVTAHDDTSKQWPAADAPNVSPYEGMHIPGDTKSSIQWSRQAPDKSYLAPVGVLHAPVPVAAVPPIAPLPGKFRFGDSSFDIPAGMDSEQAIQINDQAATTEANLATFLDSIGMERSRSDRIAGQTVGTAAMGAMAGAGSAVPIALTSATVGAALGLVVGLPLFPVGLVAGPALGAAAGAAVIEVPAAAAGAVVGAMVGAVNAYNAPPRVVGD